MERTKQAGSLRPAFAWWPWCVLSIMVPMVAVFGGYVAMASEAVPPHWTRLQAAMLTAFTVFGAGNGFLLGVAIGDFGRSMLAMIAGAFIALVLVPLYDGPGLFLAPPAMVCAMMVTLALEWTWSGMWNAVWTGIVSLFLACIAGGFALGMLLIVGALFAALDYKHESVMLALLGLGLGIGNAVFIGRVFRAAYRVQGSGPA